MSGLVSKYQKACPSKLIVGKINRSANVVKKYPIVAKETYAKMEAKRAS